MEILAQTYQYDKAIILLPDMAISHLVRYIHRKRAVQPKLRTKHQPELQHRMG